MAEKEAPKPILQDGLNLAQKSMLAQMASTPGYEILIMLIEAMCTDATNQTVKADPEDPNYDQVIKARHQYARAVNKSSTLLLKSVEYHIENAIAEEAQAQIDAIEAAEAAQAGQ